MLEAYCCSPFLYAGGNTQRKATMLGVAKAVLFFFEAGASLLYGAGLLIIRRFMVYAV